MKSSRIAVKALIGVCILSVSSPTNAGGVLGNMISAIGNATGVQPIRQLGEDLDRAHAEFKGHNPNYKCLEEKITELARAPGTAMCLQAFEAVTQTAKALCSGFASQSPLQAKREDAEIELAKAQLVQSGLVGAEEFAGVSIRWCQGDFNGHGITPDSEQILLNQVLLENPWTIAPMIAHEMTHIRQLRRMGTNNFKCDYATKMIACGCQDRRHALENEAMNFQDLATAKLTKNYYQLASIEVTPWGEVRTFQFGGMLSLDGPTPVFPGVDAKAHTAARDACTTARNLAGYDSQECVANMEIILANLDNVAAQVRRLSRSDRSEALKEISEDFEDACSTMYSDDDDGRETVSGYKKSSCVAEARRYFMAI